MRDNILILDFLFQHTNINLNLLDYVSEWIVDVDYK